MTRETNINNNSETPYFQLNADKLNIIPMLSSVFLQVRQQQQLTPLFDMIASVSSATIKHSRGVAAVAQMMGKQLGCDEETTQMLALSGMLHDIGKITIPDDILNKAGPLSSDEALVMRSHVDMTIGILSAFSVQPQVQKWCAFHHERLNGTGYPFGLGATVLDQGCRIMSLADVFVALTENRIYRNGLDPQEVIEAIEHMVGLGSLDEPLFNLLKSDVALYNETRLFAQQSSLIVLMPSDPPENLRCFSCERANGTGGRLVASGRTVVSTEVDNLQMNL